MWVLAAVSKARGILQHTLCWSLSNVDRHFESCGGRKLPQIVHLNKFREKELEMNSHHYGLNLPRLAYVQRFGFLNMNLFVSQGVL